MNRKLTVFATTALTALAFAIPATAASAHWELEGVEVTQPSKYAAVP